MQGGKLRYYRPGIQSGRGLGGVLRGMGKIASAAKWRRGTCTQIHRSKNPNKLRKEKSQGFFFW